MSNTAVSQWIASAGIWPLLIMLIPTVFVFRKYRDTSRTKRIASLSHAIAVFVFTSVAAVIPAFGLTDVYLVPALAVITLAAYLLRRTMFPYRMACPDCGKRHDIFTAEFKNIYVFDDNLCDACRSIAGGDESG